MFAVRTDAMHDRETEHERQTQRPQDDCDDENPVEPRLRSTQREEGGERQMAKIAFDFGISVNARTALSSYQL